MKFQTLLFFEIIWLKLHHFIPKVIFFGFKLYCSLKLYDCYSSDNVILDITNCFKLYCSLKLYDCWKQKHRHYIKQSFKLYCSLKLYDWKKARISSINERFLFQTLLFFEIIWLSSMRFLQVCQTCVSNSIVLWNYMIVNFIAENISLVEVSNSIVLWNYMIVFTPSIYI